MALLPLVLLLFGIGFFAKTLVVAIAAFFPMVINSMAGVSHLDPNYFDVARLYRASRWRVFWRIVVPGSLPMSLTGARLALVRALGATIGLELITAQTGLGSLLFFAWQTFRTEALFATLFVIARSATPSAPCSMRWPAASPLAARRARQLIGAPMRPRRDGVAGPVVVSRPRIRTRSGPSHGPGGSRNLGLDR
jgi:ABC-type phosphate transport system permease subunit